MEIKTLLTTRELAQFLNINEKMVYTLISEKDLPATKATGKWLFPRHLVEQWLEAQTINFPKNPDPLPPYDGLLIIAGSNDILLDRTISLVNQHHPEQMVANFCRREQGLLIEKGNPRGIGCVADLNQAGIKIINRPLGTGTRLLLDEELAKAGIPVDPQRTLFRKRCATIPGVFERTALQKAG